MEYRIEERPNAWGAINYVLIEPSGIERPATTAEISFWKQLQWLKKQTNTTEKKK